MGRDGRLTRTLTTKAVGIKACERKSG